MILALRRRRVEMAKRVPALFVMSLLVTFGFAKDKTKNTLPAYVLEAHTVAVIIDPKAGISIDDPRANQAAQKDVEAAFLKWGRFEPVSEPKTADLIVVVRKVNSRLMDETLPDPRQNNGINPGNRGGGSSGPPRTSQPDMPNEPGLGPSQQGPRSSTDMGDAEDSFAVFKGGENPLYATPVWTYSARDGLSPQGTPAVAAFKRAVAAADKAADKAAAEKH
jgi:hypothetical protein